MPEELKDIAGALKELQELTTKGLADKADYHQQVERLNARLDEADKLQSKQLAEISAAKNAQLDAEERLKSLEKKLSRMRSGGTVENSEEYDQHKKHFSKLLISGHKELRGEDYERASEMYLNKKTLSTDVNTSGGYLVPEIYDNMILKKITEFSPVRQLARVIQTGGNEVSVPTRETNATAAFRGERSTRDESEQTYGLIRIPTNCLDADIPITVQMLRRSGFNMETELFNDAAEAFGAVEGNKFLNGTGVEQPLGILFSSKVPTFQAVNAASAAGKFDGDDLINLTGQLKRGYAPTFMLSRATSTYIRTLKSTDGQYLMTAGGGGRLAGGIAMTINGYAFQVASNDDMVAHSVSSGKSVLFGDFMRGYTITDGIGMEVLRDDYSKAAQRIVVFRFTRETGGGITMPEAFVTLTNKV